MQEHKSPSTQWNPEHLEAWQQTSKVIYNVLSRFPHIHDLHGAVEDTRQETFIHAHQGLSTFDETKGDFAPWIRSIAIRCAYAYLQDLKGDSRRQSAVEAQQAVDGLATSSALESLLELTSTEERLQDLATVLSIAIKVLGDIEPVTRVLNLILVEEPLTYRTAANILDIAERTLYKSCTKVLMYTEVIYRALLIYRHRQEEGDTDCPVLMREVISCLPQTEMGKEPHFTHRVTEATLDAGHVDDIDIQALAASCQWSYAYTQRCICTTTQLFNLALSVIQQGGI